MYLAKVFVTLKKGVLDPQGLAVKNALASMGYSEVSQVRVGKFMELTFDRDETLTTIKERLTQMCERLLSNPVIENYHFEIEEQMSV